RRLPSVPSSVTVIRDAAGRYFASFVIETDPGVDLARMPEADNLPSVGIDLGLTHFAVLSDGRVIDSPRFLRRAEKKLKKAQREVSRKQKRSKNRAKARLKVARAHAQVADARSEFHHQLSTQLIRESQAVAVEDLAVKGLARTRLGKSVHDAGWARFVKGRSYSLGFGRGVSCHRLFRLPGCGHVAVAPVVHALADAGEHRKRVDLFGQEPANIRGFEESADRHFVAGPA
ncbi:RNA-guided endonuclease InsQ/TnpB family protein, partial [Streptomyces mirabilis]|uniref:RNA-guided endonuclease InsQ/TnpB family protein n=1 Tax=Streptomyces mirabilis TaxID=68239 RepID=UPI00369C99F3